MSFLPAFASFSLNHLIDITWHLAFARSVFHTGDLTEGFMAVLRAGDTSQIHGKIWYQIMAVFTITISKEKNLNNVRLYEGRTIEQINSPGNSIYQGYDTQGKDRLVTYDFGKNKEFVLFLRGDYTFRDIVTGLTFHMSHTLKKVYFGTYFVITFIFLSLGLGLIFKNRVALKRMKSE